MISKQLHNEVDKSFLRRGNALYRRMPNLTTRHMTQKTVCVKGIRLNRLSVLDYIIGKRDRILSSEERLAEKNEERVKRGLKLKESMKGKKTRGGRLKKGTLCEACNQPLPQEELNMASFFHKDCWRDMVDKERAKKDALLS